MRTGRQSSPILILVLLGSFDQNQNSPFIESSSWAELISCWLETIRIQSWSEKACLIWQKPLCVSLPFRRRFLYPSSSRPSGTAVSSSPQQQRSPDKLGQHIKTAAPPQRHPHSSIFIIFLFFFAESDLTDRQPHQLTLTLYTEIQTFPLLPYQPITA